jgi:hypothetical protein
MMVETTRRALSGLFAALVAAPLPAAAHDRDRGLDIEALLFEPDEPTPPPATIPGFEQITTFRAVLTVITDDGRVGVLHLVLTPDVPVRFRHPGGLNGEIPVRGHCLASFPNWLQRELGYAALGAVSAVEEVPS